MKTREHTVRDEHDAEEERWRRGPREGSHGRKGRIQRDEDEKSWKGGTWSQTKASGNFSNDGRALEFREFFSFWFF